MKEFFLSIFLLLLTFNSHSQNKEGKILVQKFHSSSIQNNKGGEDPMRQVSVYLPPGYEESTERYPTIYFLHGFAANDNLLFEWLDLKKLMDEAINKGRIRPMILVLPNSDTRFKGSFYTNSTLTGNWADFIGKDVVTYTDKNFRTIPERNSRGLSGHSMGGNGALKIGMLFSDVFAAVYAMSPAVLNWSHNFTIRNNGFKRISKAKNETDIFQGFDNPENTDDATFYTVVLTTMARAYSPDEKNMPLQVSLPVSYIGDSAVYNIKVIKQWEANFPINMIDTHLEQLKSLKAIKIDWGRNEEFAHIPATALQFSKKLEAYRINHFAEEDIGDHVNKLGGFDGRIYTELFPFFDTYLKFEEPTGMPLKLKS
ncbi:MAG: esterase family protein [Flavisolibacter sp.]|nr:esterase family protein [Flavisolibacter sp.]